MNEICLISDDELREIEGGGIWGFIGGVGAVIGGIIAIASN